MGGWISRQVGRCGEMKRETTRTAGTGNARETHTDREREKICWCVPFWGQTHEAVGVIAGCRCFLSNQTTVIDDVPGLWSVPVDPLVVVTDSVGHGNAIQEEKETHKHDKEQR